MDIFKAFDNDEFKKADSKSCPGLIFQCHISCYLSKEFNLVEKTELILLKRKSCKHPKECENCSFWYDLFTEESDYWKGDGIPCNKAYFEDGKLYTPVGHSYQSYDGDWDFEWEFQEVL